MSQHNNLNINDGNNNSNTNNPPPISNTNPPPILNSSLQSGAPQANPNQSIKPPNKKKAHPYHKENLSRSLPKNLLDLKSMTIAAKTQANKANRAILLKTCVEMSLSGWLVKSDYTKLDDKTLRDCVIKGQIDIIKWKNVEISKNLLKSKKDAPLNPLGRQLNTDDSIFDISQPLEPIKPPGTSKDQSNQDIINDLLDKYKDNPQIIARLLGDDKPLLPSFPPIQQNNKHTSDKDDLLPSAKRRRFNHDDDIFANINISNNFQISPQQV